jgi:pyruvoyl-dependent arginine decarboxylase
MGPFAKGVFLTKGVGKHREKLNSFELALRSANIAEYNLVRVQSIFPPYCKLITPGQRQCHRRTASPNRRFGGRGDSGQP